MKNVTSMSKADVHALVTRSALEQDVRPLDLLITRKIRARAHSSHPATAHYHSRSRNGSTEYCIKIFDTSSDEKRIFFDCEAELLEKLSQHELASSVPMTPAVRLAHPPTGVLVMEWLDGTSLKSDLMIANYRSERRNRLLRMSAQWLRKFHEASGIQRKPVDALAMLHEMQAGIDKLSDRQQEQLRADNTTARAVDLLRERAASINGTLSEWGLHHRDFTPSNLIVSPKGEAVRGFDFGKATDVAPVSFDLATFTLRAWDISAALMLKRTRAGDLRLSGIMDAVLNGYDPDLSESDRNWISWCVLHKSINRKLQYYKSRDMVANRSLARYMKSYLMGQKTNRFVQAACDRF